MPDIGAVDLTLIVVVTAMAVGVAYLHSPRAKALLYMLPFPFTVALISTGKGIDATHVLGFLVVSLFPWNVYLLHRCWGLPILLADGLALACHVAISLLLARVVPVRGAAALGLSESVWFALLLALTLVGGGAVIHYLPHRDEAGHRSPLPPAVKVPCVLVLISALVLGKDALRGFMPSFPMVTVFAVYEARKSLYTLAGRFPICLLSLIPLLLIGRAVIPYAAPGAADYALGLGLGWAFYFPLYLVLNRRYNRPHAEVLSGQE